MKIKIKEKYKDLVYKLLIVYHLLFIMKIRSKKTKRVWGLTVGQERNRNKMKRQKQFKSKFMN
jgi:hypothetical protein